MTEEGKKSLVTQKVAKISKIGPNGLFERLLSFLPPHKAKARAQNKTFYILLHKFFSLP
jgi:hypothetical protein